MSADYVWVYSLLDLLAMAPPLCTGKSQVNIVWNQHLAPTATAEQMSCKECLQPLLGTNLAQARHNC